MSKMGAEFIKQSERQFGTELLLDWSRCRWCGQEYRVHDGVGDDSCPPEPCPYTRRREPVDFCELNDRVCLLETEDRCAEYSEIKREWREEGKGYEY